MRELQEFKNIHKDMDIYVLASGKSVDFIDNSFFDNKIIIGINQVYKKVFCSYLVRKEANFIKKVIEENKDAIHFISRGNCGNRSDDSYKKTANQLKDIDTKNVVLYEHNSNNHDKGEVKLPKEDNLYVSFSTITTGIHLAAYMGAKNIILIGHDCGSLNGECNFKGYHDKKTRQQSSEGHYKNWLSKIQRATIDLKKVLKEKYDCNVYSLNPFINFSLEGNIYRISFDFLR